MTPLSAPMADPAMAAAPGSVTPRANATCAPWPALNWLLRLAAVCLFLVSASLAVAGTPSGRLTGTFEGIECEYSPGQEELAQLLAHRFVVHNQEVVATQAAAKLEPPAVVPLSPAEMRANRAVYLGRIAAQLGLEKPTPLQEECYDAFLDNYGIETSLSGMLRDLVDKLVVVKRITIWQREELIRRLGAGETVAGMTYDPVTNGGNSKFGFNVSSFDDRFKDSAAKREKLHRDYQMSFSSQNGQTVYRGSVSPKKKPSATAAKSPPADTGEVPELLPVVIPSELANASAAEQAQRLWDGFGARSLARMLEAIANMKKSFQLIDPHLGFIVLHETTELGIMDHYFRGRDRRWFCDGVANYVPWRVVRDLHGETVAATVYDLPKELSRYAPLREQADLRKWPAAENQTEEEQRTELNSARYAFAANVVFLMNARAGEDILPKLFAEIGKTKPDKVSIKTVENAWKKLTGSKLDSILTDAVKPIQPVTSPK